MAADFVMKAGQTARTFKVTITSTETGAVVDVTGYTLSLLCDPAAGGATTTLSLTLSDPTNGIVSRTFGASDLAAGRYRAIITGTTGGALAVKWPDDGYISIDIQSNLT